MMAEPIGNTKMFFLSENAEPFDISDQQLYVTVPNWVTKIDAEALRQ